MKRILSLSLVLLLCLSLCLTVLAQDELTLITDDEPAAMPAAEDGAWYIRDFAGLLTAGEQSALEQRAESLSAQYGCDIYVLTVDSIGSMNRRDYAKAYYQQYELGNGSWRNGILFLVAMESRDYVTVTYGQDPDNPSTYGTGIYAFSDYGVSVLEDKVVPYLSDGDYEGAFAKYVEICGDYLKQYTETGEPFDVGNAPRSKAIPLAITVLVPILIALIVCLIFRSQMKTARAATEANSYIPQDGFNLTRQIDQYTHTRTVRHIERDSGGSGGGSSVDSGGFGGSSGGKF